MSGGSYNYLCHKDVEDLMSLCVLEDLEQMRDRLLGLGYLDAAGQTDAVIATIHQCKELVRMRAEALGGVWKAVEWEDSCDGYAGQVEDAIKQYRKK